MESVPYIYIWDPTLPRHFKSVNHRAPMSNSPNLYIAIYMSISTTYKYTICIYIIHAYQKSFNLRVVHKHYSNRCAIMYYTRWSSRIKKKMYMNTIYYNTDAHVYKHILYNIIRAMMVIDPVSGCIYIMFKCRLFFECQLLLFLLVGIRTCA